MDSPWGGFAHARFEELWEHEQAVARLVDQKYGPGDGDRAVPRLVPDRRPPGPRSAAGADPNGR